MTYPGLVAGAAGSSGRSAAGRLGVRKEGGAARKPSVSVREKEGG